MLLPDVAHVAFQGGRVAPPPALKSTCRRRRNRQGALKDVKLELQRIKGKCQYRQELEWEEADIAANRLKQLRLQDRIATAKALASYQLPIKRPNLTVMRPTGW